VQVEVEDVLSRSASGVLSQIHSDGSELVSYDPGKEPSSRHGRGRFLRFDGPDISPVFARNDQEMAPRGGRLAEEGDGRVIAETIS